MQRSSTWLSSTFDGSGIGRELGGERFAISPHRAVLKVLFLPNRHAFLEIIDQPLASLEGSRTMCRGHGHKHAGFADVHSPKTVNDHRLPYVELSLALVRQQLHLLQCHRLISFVIEKQRLAAAAVVPHNAFKNATRSISWLAEAVGNRLYVDPLPHDRDIGSLGCRAPPATDRGQESNFIVFAESCGGLGVLLIDRDSQAATHRPDLRELC